MGEIKSVKVDNWGVFFLQKLQNFFNKTDYCDMTLQFNDNSQLKVHRLVLSACTDYFNLLESNCELIDDALVMPNDLQADVVVPIVNFMYTGTLEFELNMYNKLLRTARDMNMTVLLKLLEAHRRTMEQSSVLSKPQVTATQVRSGAGRTYPAMLSPTKPTTMQRGSIPTHAQGARNASNISRRPVATQQRGNIVIKEETSFDPSPFEQLRQSGINYKRPASKTYETPPEKKPSIEDVKEFAEQQRMRKQIAAEVSGIPAEDEYVESYMEDEFTQDDEDEDNTGAQITIKQEPNQKPTIVFKASADNKMDHAKIIGEVLKKYPHLIKNNKNLKLKIMPNSGPSQQQKLVVKKEEETQQNKPIVQQQIISRPTQVQATATETAPKPSGPPKKIDSKTMHALIALGAENTTGPWLCLRCGVNGRPISIPSYRGFRRHLINTHREKIDPRLCEHCGYRSSDVRDLHFHVQVDHQITSTAFTFPRCEYCAQCFITNAILNKHIEESHTKNQQCIYCNEVYPKENDLYNHMKIAHKKQAQNDGVIDFSDGEDGDENEFLKFNTEDKKIKILSDISLPTTSVTINEGTKFVTADGSEMVLSDEQRDQLMAQLDPNQDTGGIIMVLNESFQLPDQQHVVESVVGEQVQEQHQQEEQQQVQEKQDEENMFVYKEMDADDENMDEEERQEEHQEDESGNIEAEEKEDEPEKMQADEELDEEEIEQEHQSEVNASEDAKKLDEKLKMITGEWTDDEAEEERTDEQISEKIDKTASEPIKKEEVIEKSEEAPSAEQQQEEPLETEAEEKNKDDQVEENAELDSPLKQELMEFLGIENMDEPVDEKVSEDEKGQQDAQSAEDEEHEKDIQEQVKQEMIEQAMKLADEKSTAEVEMEDELTQLREEIESNAPVKEENVDHAEEQAQRKPVSEEISDSELQQQLESEDEKPQDVADSTEAQVESSKPASDQEVKDDGDGNKDANDEEVTSQAPAEEEPAKDALKSIITDWADEGDAQDDDL